MFDHLLRELYPTPLPTRRAAPPRLGLAVVTAALYFGVRLDVVCPLASGDVLAYVFEPPAPWSGAARG